MTIVTRAEWQALPPKSDPGTMTSHRGVAVHWTGDAPYAKPNHDVCDDQVRAIQRFHQSIPDQSDIEYQALVCIHGYVFEGRVYGWQGGANGTKDANEHYHSVCALVGAGDELTDELLDGIEAAAVWLGAGPEWTGHRDHKATHCPGDALYAWTKGRHPWRAVPPTPAPQPAPPEDPMLAGWITEYRGGQWVVAPDLSWRTPIVSAADMERLLTSGAYHALTFTEAQVEAIPAAGSP